MPCTEASVPRKVHQTDAIISNRLIIQECYICDVLTQGTPLSAQVTAASHTFTYAAYAWTIHKNTFRLMLCRWYQLSKLSTYQVIRLSGHMRPYQYIKFAAKWYRMILPRWCSKYGHGWLDQEGDDGKRQFLSVFSFAWMTYASLWIPGNRNSISFSWYFRHLLRFPLSILSIAGSK